jgi:hypothetical protein
MQKTTSKGGLFVLNPRSKALGLLTSSNDLLIVSMK